MEAFDELVSILKKLLSPEGCPWDRAQTFQSLRRSLIEETYEVVEAIDLNNLLHLKEELGDLFLNLIFLCELGEQAKVFSTKDVLTTINQKLIRRHPHVFGDSSVQTPDQVAEQWEAIKKQEKSHSHRKSILDGIPKDLPTLARAQQVMKKLAKSKIDFQLTPLAENASQEEKDGQFLWDHLQEMFYRESQADQALRKRLTQIEQEIYAYENQHNLLQQMD